MIVLEYIKIEGTVGDTKIDLTFGIPAEQIIKNLPAIADVFLNMLPDFKKKVEEITKKLE